MKTTGWLLTIALLTFVVRSPRLSAQSAPPAPGVVWQPRGMQTLDRSLAAKPHETLNLDPERIYTLAELIDLAEQHNPETRVAWEDAKSKTAALGIARSTLYPTMSAVALAISLRQAALIGEFFHRQTEAFFEPLLQVEYLVFDTVAAAERSTRRRPICWHPTSPSMTRTGASSFRSRRRTTGC